MKKGRIEAFSDGVLAIIITIMVLEMKVPHGEHISDLKPLLPVFLSYILSFVNIGLYWNNHHHLFQAVEEINGKVLWANTHLLFWLSLLPFATGWMGENHFTQWPVILYGIDLLMCSIAYFILVKVLLKVHSKNSTFAKAIGNDKKGKISTCIYIVGIVCAFIHPLIGLGSFLVVLAIWFIPDTRIEKKIVEKKPEIS
jgi:uncharacterized membrane protein